MKIFYITHTFSLNVWDQGGGEVYCSNILKELRKRGHEIMVFTPDCKHFPEEEELGIKVYRSPTWGHHAFHKYEYAMNAKKAIELARAFHPDVIHAQNDVFPALIGSAVKKELKIPLIVGMEFLSHKNQTLNTKFTYHLNKFFLPKLDFDFLISMGQHFIDHELAEWGIPKEKMKVIPLGVDTEEFSPSVGMKTELLEQFGSHLLISLKPLHSTNAKGIGQILRAFKIVLEKHPEYHYLIYGWGAKGEETKQLVKELDLEKNVHFLGLVNYNETPQIYNSSEFLVHVFTYDATTSSSLIDSMAVGKAIIATRIGEIPNIVDGAGILIPQNNIEILANEMLRLIEAPALRKGLGEKARKVVLERFSLKKTADELEALYSTVQ